MDIAVKEPTEVIETNKVGRPCKYESHVQPHLDNVLQWLKNGMNEYSICDKLGISNETWIQYKSKYTELSELYTRATRERNCLVMNAQFEKAKGIKETVKKPIKVKRVEYKDGKRVSEEERIEYADEMLYVPPDTNAADLFLRNNDPEYKSAKADTSGLTLVQNNYNIPELKQSIQELLTEYKTLDAIDITSDE